jgi:hypothetical protein
MAFVGSFTSPGRYIHSPSSDVASSTQVTCLSLPWQMQPATPIARFRPCLSMF